MVQIISIVYSCFMDQNTPMALLVIFYKTLLLRWFIVVLNCKSMTFNLQEDMDAIMEWNWHFIDYNWIQILIKTKIMYVVIPFYVFNVFVCIYTLIRKMLNCVILCLVSFVLYFFLCCVN